MSELHRIQSENRDLAKEREKVKEQIRRKINEAQNYIGEYQRKAEKYHDHLNQHRKTLDESPSGVARIIDKDLEQIKELDRVLERAARLAEPLF